MPGQITTGSQLLRGRYQLVGESIATDGRSQSWTGVDDDDSRYIIRLWPYRGDRPDDLRRALWDAELRNLYRVGSSPGAEDTILVLRDAGVDARLKCFVMVLAAPGFATLASALERRSEHVWLQDRSPSGRRRLWHGLRRLAEGIQLLHGQHILHRDVGAETVFFDPDLGVESLRLGGFEWSVRLGIPSAVAPPANWSTPPEFFSAEQFGYRPETDWFGFGILATRLLLNVESHRRHHPETRHARLIEQLERSGAKLSGLERGCLLRLIAKQPNDRLSRAYDLITTIDDIVRGLSQQPRPHADHRPLVVGINPGSCADVLEQAYNLGFSPDPDRPQEAFNPRNVVHTANLTAFVQRDLREAELYATPGSKAFVLVGARFTLRIIQFERVDRVSGKVTRSWDVAYCVSTGVLWWNEGGSACTKLPLGVVVVRTKADLSKRARLQNSRSWNEYLPRIDKSVQLRSNLARFHDFIRCTNQLELLIRDSELFRYRVHSHTSDENLEKLLIAENLRERPSMSFCKVDGGLAGFLSREIDSGKPDCRLVVLSSISEDSLNIETVEKADAWTVESVEGSRITLSRIKSGLPRESAPKTGTVRAWGMFGQVALVRRRKRAIDRLEAHSYLLRSLSAPGQVYMDTGAMPLPVALSPDKVDEAKQAAIEDILRVRPIYALQGPPGTGKTTLVAHLLRQIFHDDPVAQVLITAQAHGAVDVLRAKVRDEAFRGVAEDKQPLAVRLGATPRVSGPTEGSVEDVSREILSRSRAKLAAQQQRTSLQQEWLAAVETMLASLRSYSPSGGASDFCEVVKRGANITYCTTSAGDLEVLAEAAQSFDWAIVEEAGKAHGFDLALPLHAGHRWLLIGDHKQLPPYRFRDYRDGLDVLDDAVAALEALPGQAGGLLDRDWLRAWRDKAPEQREEFKEYAREWLNTFERVFEYCSVATGEERITLDVANGSAAGRLSRQHRMHPTIGSLISKAYYGERLVNRTSEGGRPLARVTHGFTRPKALVGRSVVWLDLPAALEDSSYSEVGPKQQSPRYTNPKEIDALISFVELLRAGPRETAGEDGEGLTVAVLSPYNQQVTLMNQRLAGYEAGLRGLGLSPARASGARDAGLGSKRRIAHTVDSFQGNQADVIVVSLVRNNNEPVGRGLGFLDEASRINVLLSRAERLLVLVGSWDFFRHQLRAVALDDPQLPLWHWKKVLVTLEEWFDSGAAVRLRPDGTLIGGRQ